MLDSYTSIGKECLLIGVVLRRIMACDREEKHDELVKEFAGNVRASSQPDLRSQAGAE